jgi:hypothetical protein
MVEISSMNTNAVTRNDGHSVARRRKSCLRNHYAHSLRCWLQHVPDIHPPCHNNLFHLPYLSHSTFHTLLHQSPLLSSWKYPSVLCAKILHLPPDCLCTRRDSRIPDSHEKSALLRNNIVPTVRGEPRHLAVLSV